MNQLLVFLETDRIPYGSSVCLLVIHKYLCPPANYDYTVYPFEFCFFSTVSFGCITPFIFRLVLCWRRPAN
ncbi:hypothetical protein XELAEV_18022102mg [Xenopus laevis]|uniref:Uncharacterized protein n=1 Tax=Xenopus laevis TaxID=8355 RepID=A0A974D1Q4_XENLA|nr:hypothetical protein XELAEV_18022102mg [Xenopus laevis]